MRGRTVPQNPKPEARCGHCGISTSGNGDGFSPFLAIQAGIDLSFLLAVFPHSIPFDLIVVSMRLVPVWPRDVVLQIHDRIRRALLPADGFVARRWWSHWPIECRWNFCCVAVDGSVVVLSFVLHCWLVVCEIVTGSLVVMHLRRHLDWVQVLNYRLFCCSNYCVSCGI